MQSFTSANTSINKNQLPAVFKKVKFKNGDTVLDYGCGKYTEHVRGFLAENSDGTITYCPLDPYNQPDSINAKSLFDVIANGGANVIICSNVLNVIDSDETIKQIVESMKGLTGTLDSTICVTVYEGDKTGVGRQTGPDQYQRNERLKNYIRFFDDSGWTCSIRNSVLYVRKER